MKTERNRGILARKVVALVLVFGFVFALSSAVYANQFTLDEITRWGTDETIISISVDIEPIEIYRDVQIRGYGDDEWEHITPIFTVQMGTTLTTDVNLDFGADRQFDTNIIIGIRPSTAVLEETRILEFAIVDAQFIGSENVATYTLSNVGEFEFVISEWSDRGKGAIYFARIIVVDGATAPSTEIVPPTPTPPTPEEPVPHIPPAPPAPTVTPTATPDTISVTIDGVAVADSIADLAARYDGGYSTEYKNGIFTATVSLVAVNANGAIAENATAPFF